MSIRLHKVCTALASSMLLFMQGSIAATFTLEEATVDDITKAMDAGALSSEQLVRLYLARIAAYEDGGPTLNAIITLNPNALKEAATLDRERKMRGLIVIQLNAYAAVRLFMS